MLEQKKLRSVNLKKALFDYERDLILLALKNTNGNKTYAAMWLEIKRTTLVMKIRKFKLQLYDHKRSEQAN